MHFFHCWIYMVHSPKSLFKLYPVKKLFADSQREFILGLLPTKLTKWWLHAKIRATDEGPPVTSIPASTSPTFRLKRRDISSMPISPLVWRDERRLIKGFPAYHACFWKDTGYLLLEVSEHRELERVRSEGGWNRGERSQLGDGVEAQKVSVGNKFG